MVRIRNRFARPSVPGPLNGPLYDDRALVVSFTDPGGVKNAVASLESGDAPEQHPGLRRLHEYIARTEGAALTPLFEARAGERLFDSAAGLEKSRWEIALPAGDDTRVVQHLRLPSTADTTMIEEALRGESGVDVHRPAIVYPAPMPNPFTWKVAGHQWGLTKCRFPEVWTEMDSGEHSAPIAVIDSGDDTLHRELKGCITRYVPPSQGKPSRSVHASAVAGVIAAIRGDGDEKGMAGCCSAKVHLFNVWNTTEFDSKAFYGALDDVLASDTRVVNLSMTSRAPDPTRDELIRKCAARDKVVVAAMGDFEPEGSPPMFPAAHPDVIAVGSTDRHDRRFTLSSTGGHIWISAPGEDIWTVFGKRRFQPLTGTSYATPMVSAAVWLALRKRPELTLEQVRKLLTVSVGPKPKGKPIEFNEIGHGRLDMVELRNALPTV
jgi:hypothetical protein